MKQSFSKFTIFVLITAACIGAVFLVPLHSQQPALSGSKEAVTLSNGLIEQMHSLKRRVEGLEQVSVPIGGVIMWWGSVTKLPPNFELCDGGPATNSGAKLEGLKPDLRDRFAKGATTANPDVQTGKVAGGSHSTNLSLAPIIAGHRHKVEPHRHNAELLWAPFTGHAGAIWWMENAFHRGDIGAPGYDSVRQRERSAANELSRGTAIEGETGLAAPYTSGGEELGSLQLPLDKRPEFLEVHFIIRVR